MLLNKETLQAVMGALNTKPEARAASCLSDKEAGKDKPFTVCVYWAAPGKNTPPWACKEAP